jgi:hypothetical protein
MSRKMKSLYVLIFFSAFSSSILYAQSIKIERRILATDTVSTGGIKVPVSSDDAEQENNEMDALFDDDIDAGWEGAPEDQNILTAGLRFRQIDIPQGAKIDSAFLTIWSHEGKSAEDIANINIYVDANVNAPTFKLDSLIFFIALKVFILMMLLLFFLIPFVFLFFSFYPLMKIESFLQNTDTLAYLFF